MRVKMLETREERARLLKAGISGKTIEELYIAFNDIKIVRSPMYFELAEVTLPAALRRTLHVEALTQQYRDYCNHQILGNR